MDSDGLQCVPWLAIAAMRVPYALGPSNAIAVVNAYDVGVRKGVDHAHHGTTLTTEGWTTLTQYS